MSSETEEPSTSIEIVLATGEGVPKLVWKLGPNDVLVGRGAPSNNNRGNQDYRELVRQRKADYTKTKKRQSKDQIAREIVSTISARNGQFLRKLESQEEAAQLGVDADSEVWLVVPTEVAIRKTKQALRDKEIPSGSRFEESENEASKRVSSQDHHVRGQKSGNILSDNDDSLRGANVLVNLLGQQQQVPATMLAPFGFPAELGNGLNEQLGPSRLLADRLHQADGTQAFNPAFASLLLAQNRLQQQAVIDQIGSLASSDALVNALAPSSNLLSTLALQQSLSSQRQLQNSLDNSLMYRLLGSTGMPTAPADAARLQISQFLEAQRHPQVSLNSMKAKANPGPTLTEESKVGRKTRVENELDLALAKRPTKEVRLVINKVELDILRVVTCHGLPVWTTSVEGQAPGPSDKYLFDWDDFGTCYQQLVTGDEPFSQSSINPFQQQNSKELAAQVIMLLEKVRVASLPPGGVRPQPGKANVLRWLDLELCVWAAHLGIIDDCKNRPLALSSQDVADNPDQGTKSVTVVGGLTEEACQSIVFQLALVARLRSVSQKNQEGLYSKVAQVHHLSIVSMQPPKPMSTNVGEDVLLLDGILEAGYTGKLLDQVLPNVSKVDAEAHIEHVITSLHMLQAEEDRDQVLTMGRSRLAKLLRDEETDRPYKRQKNEI